MRYDVVAFGEVVIDLVPVACEAGLAFAAKPGGAPGNVAAGVARLGRSAAMLSKVGDEVFGAEILGALRDAGVDTSAVVRTAGRNTALAVVTVAPDGDRDFLLYRENSADADYGPDEVSLDHVRAARILHVGSLSLAAPRSAAAQRRAIASAREAGIRISADPNFRPALWKSEAAMREAGLEVVAAAAIVKVSAEELELLAGSVEENAAVRALWHSGMLLVAVTKGPEGATLYTREHVVSVPGFPVRAVDTVGCGDAFMASLLAGLIEAGFSEPGESALTLIGLRAAAAGALMATVPGAMEMMPTEAEITRFLRSR